MTLYINGFDGGTNGATANTSAIASSGYGYTKLGATTATFSAIDAIDGGLAIEIPRTSGSSMYITTNDASNAARISTPDISISFEFTYKTALPGANDYLFDIRNTIVSGGSLLRCLTNSTGHPFLQLSGVNLGSAAVGVFVAGTKYRCDARLHVDPSAGTIHCDFYPATSGTPSFTGFSATGQNTGSTNVVEVRFGPSGTNTVTVGTFVLDLCRVDDAQSSTYFGPNTVVPPTCSAGTVQTVTARSALTLAGTMTWAAGHSGTVAWTGGTSPITNATTLTATVADIGWPALTSGQPIVNDTITYTLTATQDDAQVATSTVTHKRVAGNRWIVKGTTFQCMPPLANVTNSATPLTLPTGAGIYTYQQVVAAGSADDVQSVLTYAKSTLSATAVTFPAGNYPIIAAFTNNSNTCCVLIPVSLSLYGQGPSFTTFTLVGPLTIQNMPTGTRTVTDAVTNGTTTMTSSTGSFDNGDIGVTVAGATAPASSDIPANTKIVSINSATSVTLNNACTTGSSLHVSIGETTNPNYIFRSTGGGANQTYSGFWIDGSALATSTMGSAFKGTYAGSTTYAAGDLALNTKPGEKAPLVFRSLVSSNTGNTPTGGASDNHWEIVAFGALLSHIDNNPVLSNLKVSGIYAWSNVPPGEIASINMFTPHTTATLTDVEVDGQGVGGALVALNSNNVNCSYTLTRVNAHDSGHSHPFAAYQCQNIAYIDCIGINSGVGTGSTAGAGFNYEETYGTVTNMRGISHGNSLVGSRIEAGDNGGVNDPNFTFQDCIIQGGKYGVWCENLQTTLPTINGGTTTGTTAPTHVGTF